jgi:hypothetical protein
MTTVVSAVIIRASNSASGAGSIAGASTRAMVAGPAIWTSPTFGK